MTDTKQRIEELRDLVRTGIYTGEVSTEVAAESLDALYEIAMKAESLAAELEAIRGAGDEPRRSIVWITAEVPVPEPQEVQGGLRRAIEAVASKIN